MKKLLKTSILLLFFALSIILFQISCTKEADSQSSTSSCLSLKPTFQFKINGLVKNCDAVYNELIGWDKCPIIQQYGNKNWILIGRSGRNSSLNAEGIYLTGSTTTPVVGTSSNTNPFAVIDNIAYYFGNYTIIITKIENNRASGTFSGTLKVTSTSPSLQITEGTFSNLPIGNFDWEIRD